MPTFTANETNRIELHCHSQAGGNSTMGVYEALFYANELGMPAMAITDSNSIGSFTTMDRIYKYGKKFARPIFGVELMAHDDADPEEYSVTALIQNENGKRNAYKLISKSGAEQSNLTLDTIFANREGLLLGSGTEQGLVYKLALANASDNVLKTVITQYDYVEVVPSIEYLAVNRRIIRLCEEVCIPVVAVSDAHCAKPEEKIALKVLHNWNCKPVGTMRHLLSTEEMLMAFDYLPPEKAYEIVVTNTHTIAELCENVSIFPTENQYPVIAESSRKLREICEASLPQKYADNIAPAKKRLDQELELIEKYDISAYFLILRSMFEYSGVNACCTEPMGTCGGWLILYLLGVSRIDPLKYNIEIETLLDEADSKVNPFFSFRVPEDKLEKMLEGLSTMREVGKVMPIYNTRHVGGTNAEKAIQKYMTERGLVFTDNEKESISQLIAGNYKSTATSASMYLLLPKEMATEEITPVIKNGENITSQALEARMYYDHHFFKIGLYADDSCTRLQQMVDDLNINPETLSDDCDPDAIRLISISYGDLWEGNVQILAEEYKLDIDEVITNKDDLFAILIKNGMDRNIATEIVNFVAGGSVYYRNNDIRWIGWKKIMKEHQIPEWVTWSCERMKYLTSRADTIAQLMTESRIAYLDGGEDSSINPLVQDGPVICDYDENGEKHFYVRLPSVAK